MRQVLEPLFIKYHVDVVFAGHDHVYERVKPQNGIYYFTEGSSGELRAGDLKQSTITAKGYDSDNAFMLVEFAGSQMNFQTISRMGQSVDSGVIQRRSSANSSSPAWSVLWAQPLLRSRLSTFIKTGRSERKAGENQQVVTTSDQLLAPSSSPLSRLFAAVCHN